MDNRAWSSGASASPPAAPASPSVGYPTAGDPQTATPATKGGAYWFHQMGEELRAILTAAGITPDKTNLTQLLTALRSAGVFTTPAQFDATTKAATTAFVQRALGSLSPSSVGIASNTTLTAGYVGYLINLSSATPFTVTLPLAAAVGQSSTLHFCNTASAAVTIQRQGADVLTGGVSTITELVLQAGDRVSITELAGTWIVTNGAAQLKFAGVFGASLGASGYQKLPSGLLVQWGAFTSSGTSPGNAATTFPAAFPSACYGVLASVGGAGAGDYTVQTGALSLTTANLTTVLNTAIATGIGGYYFAYGK